MFQINDKVVCVDDCYTAQFPTFWPGVKLPTKNQVYVIRNITPIVIPPNHILGPETYQVFVTGISLLFRDSDGSITAHGFHPKRFRLLADVQAENAALAAKTQLRQLQ